MLDRGRARAPLTLLLAGALASLSCAAGDPPAVIPRYAGPLTDAETRSTAPLPYSPSDVALAWLPDDSLLVAHMEIFRAVDAVAGTCGGSGFLKLSARGGRPRVIALGEPACFATRTLPAASADGSSVVFAVLADRALRFARLDLGSLRLDTLETGCVRHAYPAVSSTGALAWSGCGVTDDGIFALLPAGAEPRKLSAERHFESRQPSWSPDGSRVAYAVGQSQRVLAVADTAGESPSWACRATRRRGARTESGSPS